MDSSFYIEIVTVSQGGGFDDQLKFLQWYCRRVQEMAYKR